MDVVVKAEIQSDPVMVIEAVEQTSSVAVISPVITEIVGRDELAPAIAEIVGGDEVSIVPAQSTQIEEIADVPIAPPVQVFISRHRIFTVSLISCQENIVFKATPFTLPTTAIPAVSAGSCWLIFNARMLIVR